MKLKFHPLFWVFLLMYLALGAFSKIGILLFSLVFHELFHLFLYKKLFQKPVSLTLLPFGGVIETSNPVEFFPGKEFLVAAVGPLANLILMFFALGIINNGFFNSNIAFLLDFNFIMAVFNFLPVLPLDGGRMLRAVLTRITNLRKATRIVSNISLVTALAVVAAGIYGFLFRLNGADVVILGVLLLFLAFRERVKNSFYFLHNLTYKEKILKEQKILNSRVLTVAPNTPLKEVVDKFLPSHYQYVVVVGRDQECLGFLSERQIMEGVLKSGLLKPVGELLQK
ncbi:site-2 protease family protein [Carboxydothermus islandicus]|nr:site-2 protease family protein [Carboxydothermus islandicus]